MPGVTFDDAREILLRRLDAAHAAVRSLAADPSTLNFGCRELIKAREDYAEAAADLVRLNNALANVSPTTPPRNPS